MKRYNVILVFDPPCENILFCMRSKPPFQGLYNLVGGKEEPGEDSLCAAYRELAEETGITQKDIILRHLMTFSYTRDEITLEAFVGRLGHPVALQEEVNSLHWLSANEDFFDRGRFAGNGNIGHMLAELRQHEAYFLT